MDKFSKPYDPKDVENKIYQIRFIKSGWKAAILILTNCPVKNEKIYYNVATGIPFGKIGSTNLILVHEV